MMMSESWNLHAGEGGTLTNVLTHNTPETKETLIECLVRFWGGYGAAH